MGIRSFISSAAKKVTGTVSNAANTVKNVVTGSKPKLESARESVASGQGVSQSTGEAGGYQPVSSGGGGATTTAPKPSGGGGGSQTTSTYFRNGQTISQQEFVKSVEGAKVAKANYQQAILQKQGATPQQLQQQRIYQMARKEQPVQQQQRFGSFSGKVEQFSAGGRPEQTQYYVGGQRVGRTFQEQDQTYYETETPAKITFEKPKVKEVVTFTPTGAAIETTEEFWDINPEIEEAQQQVYGGNLTRYNLEQDYSNPNIRQQLPAWERIKYAYTSAPGEPFSIRGGMRAFIESSSIVGEKIHFDKILQGVLPKKLFGVIPTKNIINMPIRTEPIEDIAIMTAFNPALTLRTEIVSKLGSEIPRDIVSVSLQAKLKSGKVATVTGFETTGEFAGESSGVLKSLSTKQGENIITETRGFSKLLGRTIKAQGSYGKNLYLNIGQKTSYFRGAQVSRVGQGKGTLNLLEEGVVKVYRDIDIEAAAGKGIVYEPGAKLSVNPNVIKSLMKNLDRYTTKSFAFGDKAKFVLGATKSKVGKPFGYAGLVFKYEPKQISKLVMRVGGGSKSSLEQLYQTGASDTIAQATRMVQRTVPSTLPKAIIPSVAAQSTITPIAAQSTYPQSIYIGTGLYERTGGGQIPGQVNRMNLDIGFDQFKTIPKLTSSLVYGLGERYKSGQLQQPKNLLKELLKEEQKYIQPQIPVLKTGLVQQQRQKTLQQLNLRQMQKQINKSIFFTNFPVPRPKQPKTLFPIFKLPSRTGTRATGKYSVFSKRFGKWFSLGKGLNLNQALGLGRSYTAKTLARSFKITDLLGRTPQITLPGYRKAKKGRGVVVEKSRYALNMPGEINALLGYPRRKKKKRGMFDLGF